MMTMMAIIKHNELPLHPAADVFRNQLLIEVSKENEKLVKETRCVNVAAVDVIMSYVTLY